MFYAEWFHLCTEALLLGIYEKHDGVVRVLPVTAICVCSRNVQVTDRSQGHWACPRGALRRPAAFAAFRPPSRGH